MNDEHPQSEAAESEFEEVIRRLGADGYDDEFTLHEGDVACPACNARFAAEGEPVEGVHRLTDAIAAGGHGAVGPADPVAVAVLAVRCPECGTLGHVAVGPSVLEG